MKIRPVGAKLFHADGKTDSHGKTFRKILRTRIKNSTFSADSVAIRMFRTYLQKKHSDYFPIQN
jgi:hypothetical protein